MKLGTTGSRFGTTEEQERAFIELISGMTIEEFHFGNCFGWDTIAYDIFKKIKPTVITISHPPINKSYYKPNGDITRKSKEYLERNKDIVNESDIIIACPITKEKNRSGTWHTIRYAQSKSKLVIIIEPNGCMSAVKGETPTDIEKWLKNET